MSTTREKALSHRRVRSANRKPSREERTRAFKRWCHETLGDIVQPGDTLVGPDGYEYKVIGYEWNHNVPAIAAQAITKVFLGKTRLRKMKLYSTP